MSCCVSLHSGYRGGKKVISPGTTVKVRVDREAGIERRPPSVNARHVNAERFGGYRGQDALVRPMGT